MSRDAMHAPESRTRLAGTREPMPAAVPRLASVAPGVVTQLQRAARAAPLVAAGRHMAAERLLRDVAAALQRRQAREPHARVLVWLARLLIERGRAREAASTAADAVAVARGGAAHGIEIEAECWRVAALTDDARFADAADAGAALAARGDLSIGEAAWLAALRARASLWGGDPAAALDLVAGAGEHADPETQAWIDGVAIRVLLAAGRVFDAGTRLTEARGRAPMPAAAALILAMAQLRVLCACGDLDAAAAVMSLVVAQARSLRRPLRALRADIVWHDTLQRAGRETEARRLAAKLRRAVRAAPPALRRALDAHARPVMSRAGTPREPRAAAPLPGLIGSSVAIQRVSRLVVRAAATPFAVLIEGESGVGKELLARAVHTLGPRASRRFCDVNCAALPEELADAELFGHARGAFTGAAADRAGLFEDAHGGTLFLDEVADLSPRVQAKLLRAIQEREVRRLGETTPRRVDVRLVSAANRSLVGEVAAGRFRADLLYRLGVLHVAVPPLRERVDDIGPLAEAFWQEVAARAGTAAHLTPGVYRALARYQWPGNIRELQNVIAALAVAAPRRGSVAVEVLPRHVLSEAMPVATLAASREASDRVAVFAALRHAGGRRGEAARLLGLTRQGLQKLMTRLDLAGGDLRGQT